MLTARIFPRFFRRYTFVLSVIYASLFCVSIVVILTILYFFSFQFLREQTDQRIDEDVFRIVAGTDWPRTGTVNIRDIKNYLDNRRRLHSKSDPSVYLLVDRDNNFISGNINRWPSEYMYLDGQRAEFISQVIHEDGSVENHPVRAIIISVGNSGFKMLVGRDILEIEALKKGFLRLLWLSVAAAVILAILGAYWVSRIASGRLKRVNALSRTVMKGDLTQRIELGASGDQFDDLAVNINQMLERIQHLVEAVRSVSDDIAHDLKTPLTRLRNDLDELARNLADHSGVALEEERTIVGRAISEADSLLTTFEAVLRIARLESNPHRDSFAAVSASELIEELAELYEPNAEEKEITLSTYTSSASIHILVDRDALAQALTNLLDNALRYTPGGGRIVLESRIVDGKFEISVADSGPGIPVQYHEEVTKRFVRLDDGSRTTPGNGLGLCLVAAVARMHKLDLKLENTQPGLKVRLRGFEKVKPGGAFEVGRD